jgi:hypothetical protein
MNILLNLGENDKVPNLRVRYRLTLKLPFLPVI